MAARYATLLLPLAGCGRVGALHDPAAEELQAAEGRLGRPGFSVAQSTTLIPPVFLELPARTPVVTLRDLARVSSLPVEGLELTDEGEAVRLRGDMRFTSGNQCLVATAPADAAGKNVWIRWRLRPDRMKYDAGASLLFLAGDVAEPYGRERLRLGISRTGGGGNYLFRLNPRGSWLGTVTDAAPLLEGVDLDILFFRDARTGRWSVQAVDELGFVRMDLRDRPPPPGDPYPPPDTLALEVNGQNSNEPSLDVLIHEVSLWTKRPGQ